MAGAVDLSGLKQRAQQKASTSGPTGPGAEPGGAAAEPGGAEITEANFEEEVIVRSDEVPVVVALWSPRSDACIELIDTLSGLAAADNGKWSLATVNIDAAPRVARIFGVEAVPTVVALAAGRPISRLPGRAARGSVAALAGLPAVGDGRKVKGLRWFRGFRGRS